MRPLKQAQPACILRRPVGAWPLPAVTTFGQTRDAISALCEREGEDPNRAGSIPAEGPLLADVRARVELVVSELAANALRHGEQPARIHVASTARTWLIGVDDGAPDREPMIGELGELPGFDPDETALTDSLGLGLAMVEAVSSDVGWYPHDEIKTVWAEVPDEPPADLLHKLRRPAPLGRPDVPEHLRATQPGLDDLGAGVGAIGAEGLIIDPDTLTG